MSDLVGNNIVGFPTRRLIYCITIIILSFMWIMYFVMLHLHDLLYCRPTGWDNDKKIAILYENLQSMKPEDAFNDVIAKPITRKVRNS